jgi:hypothetical protein
MDAEQEAARAKELRRLNASAKGFCTQFVSSGNTLIQALPLYEGGSTTSRRQTIDEAIARIRLQADKVHDAYQRIPARTATRRATALSSATMANL